MLLSIRDRFKKSKWLGYTVVVIISIPFVLFGIGSYLSSDGNQHVAVVNGNEVSLAAYEQSYAQQRFRMTQAFGGKLPATLLNSGLIQQQALEALIDQEVLRGEAKEAGYAVTDKLVRDYILKSRAFHNEGAFDKALYQQQLYSIGSSPAAYEQTLRQSLPTEQMQAGIVDSAFFTQQEAKLISALQQQQRSLTYFIVSSKATEKQITEPSDAELKAYFDANGSAYIHPEQVQLEYLELNIDAISSDIFVSDEEVQAFYEEQKSTLKTEEKRRAAHILITIDEAGSEQAALQKITEIKEKLVAGADFGELAREHSQDSGSALQAGDLGMVARGAMVAPFEEALFSLSENGISEPVKTEFGYHLIKLNQIYPATQKVYEEVKNELINQLKVNKAETAFFDKAELLANESFENTDNLDIVAEAVDLTKQLTGWLTRADQSGVAQYPEVIEAAFSEDVLKERHNSQVLEVGQNHLIVLRVTDYKPETPKTFDEAKSDIRASLKSEKLRQVLKQQAEKAVASLISGQPYQAIADEYDAELIGKGFVSRQDEEVNPQILSALFKMPKPNNGQATYQSISLNNGDQAVLILSDVRVPESSDEGQGQDTRFRAQMAQQSGNVDFSVWFDYLKSQASISRNQSVLSAN